MYFDYAEQISQLAQEQRLRFYEQLAFSLTISIRGIWSDARLSDAQKLDRIKSINEIMHRVISKISATRLNTGLWTETDTWEMINGFVAQNSGIRCEVTYAILSSYESVAR